MERKTRQKSGRRWRDELEEAVAGLKKTDDMLSKPDLVGQWSTQHLVTQLRAHLAKTVEIAESLLNRAGEQGGREEVDALDRIQRQAERIEENMRYLPELARLERGGEQQMLAMDAGVVLSGVAEAINLASGSAISLGKKHLNCPKIAVNPALTEGLLSNLALNALYRSQAGTTVILDAEFDPKLPGQVVFTCRSTGDGIPRSLCSEESQQPSGIQIKGTSLLPGLGMAFCHAAVEAQGGRFWSFVEDGVGATINFTVVVAPENRP